LATLGLDRLQDRQIAALEQRGAGAR